MAGDQEPRTRSAIAGAADRAAPQPSASGSGRASVFISYSRRNREAADALVNAIESEGYDAWIDREDIEGGERFREAIETALATAAAVVVLWSEHSVVSDYVLDEASRARKRRVLVAARVDESELPLGFGGLHTYDLQDWDRESRDHVHVRQLLDRVRELAGGRGPTHGPGKVTISRTVIRSAGAALGALLLLGWLGYRISMVIPAIVVAFMGLTAGAQYLLGRGVMVRAAARRACSTMFAVPLLVVGFALWSIVPVELDAGRSPPGVLTAAVLSAEGVVTGPKPIAADGQARLWLVVAPTGREITLRVSGHADLPSVIRPWSRARFSLGSDIAAQPTLLIRLSPDDTGLGLLDGATIEILERGVSLASVSMKNENGAALFGPKHVMPVSPLPAWRDEIRGEVPDASAEQFLALWLKPVAGAWTRAPSTVFAEVRVRLTTRGGDRWISTRLITLRGEVTDDKISLQEEP